MFITLPPGSAGIAKGVPSSKRSFNLGDLSQFKCADCHAGKNWALEGD